MAIAPKWTRSKGVAKSLGNMSRAGEMGGRSGCYEFTVGNSCIHVKGI